MRRQCWTRASIISGALEYVINPPSLHTWSGRRQVPRAKNNHSVWWYFLLVFVQKAVAISVELAKPWKCFVIGLGQRGKQ
jgi:hypothetical protein